MKLIQQSMLIRDTADNIYAALTSKEDLQHWWGLVNPKADGTTIWYGMDRTWEVPIVAAEPGKHLSFAFDSHHPYDESRTEPTTISITIAEHGNASVVTVVQSMFSDDDWNTIIHDGWVYSLISLQLWVEHGIAFSNWMNTSAFHTVNKVITLPTDAQHTWNMLTSGPHMTTWMGVETTSNPEIGGDIAVAGKHHSSGRWLLLSEPRNLVSQWTPAADADGALTIQHCTILPAVDGSIIKFAEYGHDKATVSPKELALIESGWDLVLARMQQLADV